MNKKYIGPIVAIAVVVALSIAALILPLTTTPVMSVEASPTDTKGIIGPGDKKVEAGFKNVTVSWENLPETPDKLKLYLRVDGPDEDDDWNWEKNWTEETKADVSTDGEVSLGKRTVSGDLPDPISLPDEVTIGIQLEVELWYDGVSISKTITKHVSVSIPRLNISAKPFVSFE